MSDEARRRRRLLELIDAEPTTAGSGGLPADQILRSRLSRLCAVAMSELRVSGAGVTLMGSVAGGREGHRVQLWATGPLTEQLEDLQLTSGEGPCLEAYATGRPVLVGDLAAGGGRWLGFTSEALEAGARAVFSLPLQVGASRLGTLDLHREVAERLSDAELADGLTVAGLTTEAVLDLAWEPDEPAPGTGAPGWLPAGHGEVHQATGMVAARESIAIAPALLRIRAYAFGHSVPIAEVARRILTRELVLPEQPPTAPPDGPGGSTPSSP